MADANVDPEVIKFRAERTAKLRHQFLKEMNNPHRHAEGGSLFDPAIQRYMSKKVTYWDHFKPNFKSARAFMLYTVIPIAAFAYFLDKDRSEKEHMYRTGQVAYADRRFKYQ